MHVDTADGSTATSPAPTETSQGSGQLDDLPPFAQLTTDEDRERKAEKATPGTYHVLVNPDSFMHLPEYSDDPEVKKELLSPLRRGSLATSLASSLGRESEKAVHDPNIVVLPRFEDVARRAHPRDPCSPTLPRFKAEEDDTFVEDKYVERFKQFCWRQLVLVDAEQSERPSVAVFEDEMHFYPPVCV